MAFFTLQAFVLEKMPENSRINFSTGRNLVKFLTFSTGENLFGVPPRICVKWVPFVKLVFSLGNRAHFGSKMGSFAAFSHYVFNDCGLNRGFHSDFALSPI